MDSSFAYVARGDLDSRFGNLENSRFGDLFCIGVGKMKPVRKCLAFVLLICLYGALAPFALLHLALDWVLGRCEPFASDLEAIANDE